MNLNTFCRTCLHSEEIMLPLFPINLSAADSGPITVVDLLKLFTKILISRNDGFPQQICMNCLEEIKRLYEFKLKCERSETILVKSLANILLPPKVENQNVNVITSEEMSDDLLLDSLFDADEFRIYARNEDSVISTSGELQSPKGCIEEVETVTVLKPTTMKEANSINTTVRSTKMELDRSTTFQSSVKEIETVTAFKQNHRAGAVVNTTAKLIKKEVDEPKALKTSIKEVDTIKIHKEIDMTKNDLPNNKAPYLLKIPVKVPVTVPVNQPVKVPAKLTGRKVNTIATTTKKEPVKIAPKLPLCTNLTVTQLIPIDKTKNLGSITSLRPLAATENNSQQPINNPQILNAVPVIPLSSLLHMANFFQTTNSVDSKSQQQNSMLLYKVCLKDGPKITACSVTDSKTAATIVRSDHDYPRVDSHNSTFSQSAHDIPNSIKAAGNMNDPKANDDEVFKCPACCDVFSKPDVLRQHIINSHTKDEKCMICKRENITRMHEHCWKHLPQKYFCMDCDKGFVQRDLLAKHLKRYYRKDKFECSVCSKIFCLYSDLKLHMTKHTKSKLLKPCEYCDQKFEKVQQLREHKLKEHKKSDYKCEICSKTFSVRVNFIAHKHNHIRRWPYKCDICAKSFPSKNTLKYHVATHCREHIRCLLCSKKFINRSTMRTHLRNIHPNQEPDINAKIPSSKISLQPHKQSHIGIPRSLKCDICRLVFATRTAVQKHLNTFHASSSIYKCKYCSTSFRSAHSSYQHKKTMHPIEFEREIGEKQSNCK